MQVKDLINILNECYKPTDELVVLFYSKDEFEFDAELSDEGWLKVVKVMHEEGGLESADQILSETISEMVSEYGDVVEDADNNN